MKFYLKWMNKQLMIHATFWRTLFFSAAFPITHKYLVTNVSSQILSLEMMSASIGIIVTNSLFNKYADAMFAKFKVFMAIEEITYAIIIPLVGLQIISPTFYIIIDMIIGASICNSIHCCANRLRKFTYDREMRERYDNCQPIARSASVIIGGTIGMIGFPLWVAWMFVAIGIVIDNIFYWIIYNHHA